MKTPTAAPVPSEICKNAKKRRIPRRFLFFCIETILLPFQWIRINVLPDGFVIRISSNHMIVERPLKEPASNHLTYGIDLPGRLIFVPADYLSQRRGRVSRPSIVIYSEQQVNVIRHNYIFIYIYIRKFQRNPTNTCLGNLTSLFRDGKPVPYDGTQRIFSFISANCDKITAICTVIVVRQPISLSCVKFHAIQSAVDLPGNPARFAGRCPRSSWYGHRNSGPLSGCYPSG